MSSGGLLTVQGLAVWWGSRVISPNSIARPRPLTLERERKFTSLPLTLALSSWRMCSSTTGIFMISPERPYVAESQIGLRFPGCQTCCESVSSSTRWGEVVAETPGSPKPCLFPMPPNHASLRYSAFQKSTGHPPLCPPCPLILLLDCWDLVYWLNPP